MTEKETQELIKEWRALLATERDNAFAKALCARKARRKFDVGAAGDREYKMWCCVNLKQTDAEVEVMISWAIAGGVFKDAIEFSAAGGQKGIEKIWGTGSPVEQEAVMRTAKEQALTIQTVLSRKNARNPSPMRTPVQDARQLARYLAKNADKLPPAVREIVARYVSLDNERARA